MSLLRRVKPRLSDDSEDDAETSDRSVQSDTEDDSMADASEAGSLDTSNSAPEDEDSFESEGEDAQQTLSQISFGSLARAQKSLSRDRRKTSDTAPQGDHDRIAAVKAQLAASHPTSSDTSAAHSKKSRADLHRKSKNAPQEVSAKRAVTRRREVVAPALGAAQRARDPRFDPAVQGHFDEHSFRKNYAFLEDYKDEEAKLLKAEIAKTKDESRKEQMKKKLKSMESRRQAQENKDKAASVVREHKKKERELVKSGKKAFYLKKSDIKKKILEDKYSSLSEKQLDRTIEKKRKRKAQKERKHLPWARRET